jgi:hypothetical protein
VLSPEPVEGSKHKWQEGGIEMSAQGRRAARGPVWADWFLELEELLHKGRANRRVGACRSLHGPGRKARR